MKTIDADGAGSGTAVEEVYIYDGLREERGNAGDHILLAFDESDALTHRYLYGPEVDQALASEEVTDTSSAGDVLWALTDHLGTVRDLVDYDAGTDAASVVNHLEYDAFGNITAESNATVDFLFGFTGRERDEESGLQYNRGRYYDAAVGRWMSEDPIGFNAGDPNLRRYVGNNPMGITDPSGLDWNPSAMTPTEFEQLTPDKQKKYLQSLWSLYGDHIQEASQRRNVSENLVTAVVFNEMIHYSAGERLLETYAGVGASCGPGQITAPVLKRHRIISHKMGPFVDTLNEQRARAQGARYPSETRRLLEYYDRLYDNRLRRAMNDPEESIDMLAQLINVYIKQLESKTATKDGSWGIPDLIVKEIVSPLPPQGMAADKFREELSYCRTPGYKPSVQMARIIQALTNDTETVLEEYGYNDNVKYHVDNVELVYPFIDKDLHKTHD